MRLVVARRMGGLLVGLGYLQPGELTRAAERQASAIVLDAMSVRSGSYTIDFTSEFPENIIQLPLSTERLILDGMRHIEYWSLITRGIGRLDIQPPNPARDQRPILDVPHPVETQPLRRQRQLNDALRTLGREIDRVRPAAHRHRVEHDRTRLPLRRARQLIGLEIAELHEQPAHATRSPQPP